MTPQRHFRLITLLLVIFAAFVPAFAQEAPLNGFDDYVNKALRERDVPGLAIAIVGDDRIVLAKDSGYLTSRTGKDQKRSDMPGGYKK
jgi:hypothetical protein